MAHRRAWVLERPPSRCRVLPSQASFLGIAARRPCALASTAWPSRRFSKWLDSLPGEICVRILVLTNLYPPHYIGGYELICQTVVETLWQRGHFVPILTSDHQLTSARQQPDAPGVERLLKINGLYGHPWRGMRELRHIERYNNQTLRSA